MQVFYELHVGSMVKCSAQALQERSEDLLDSLTRDLLSLRQRLSDIDRDIKVTFVPGDDRVTRR